MAKKKKPSVKKVVKEVKKESKPVAKKAVEVGKAGPAKAAGPAEKATSI
jgi:hypothetical protein